MKYLFLSTLCFILSATLAFAVDDGFLWTGDNQTNNCYNYALGVPTGTFLVPGEASGLAAEAMTCEDDFGKLGLVNAAINDGLRLVTSTDQCKVSEQVVALFNMPEMDFHWYRLEKGGVWTHKMGKRAPTDLDRSGRVITDLMSADHGQYRYFCGYFCVAESKLKVRSSLSNN